MDPIESVREPFQVFAACCSGAQALSSKIGFPLALIDVTTDIDDTMIALNRRLYGRGVSTPRGALSPLGVEKGWDDWRQEQFQLTTFDPIAFSPMPPGLHVHDGRIVVPRPARATLSEFREQLAGCLRHLRCHEVVRRAQWVQSCPRDGDRAARYDVPCWPDFARAKLVTNLYAFDPCENTMRLLVAISAALSVVNTGSRDETTSSDDKRFWQPFRSQ